MSVLNQPFYTVFLTWITPVRQLNRLQLFINRFLWIILRIFRSNTISNEFSWETRVWKLLLNMLNGVSWNGSVTPLENLITTLSELRSTFIPRGRLIYVYIRSIPHKSQQAYQIGRSLETAIFDVATVENALDIISGSIRCLPESLSIRKLVIEW